VHHRCGPRGGAERRSPSASMTVFRW
jgi:hypothetical protein